MAKQPKQQPKPQPRDEYTVREQIRRSMNLTDKREDELVIYLMALDRLKVYPEVNQQLIIQLEAFLGEFIIRHHD